MRKLYDIKTGVPGVDVATSADEPQIYGLLCMLHQENGWFRMNPVKVVAGIKHATERRGGIIFVIRKEQRIIASLGMLITSDWYSDDPYLLERWNYVHPDYRKTDAARKLIEQSKWCSDWFTQGALAEGRPPMPVQVGINSFDRTEGKVRLYARHMVCVGAFFMYGDMPLQQGKMQQRMREVEAMNEKAHRERSREVVPLAETILKVGTRTREDSHVRQQG